MARLDNGLAFEDVDAALQHDGIDRGRVRDNMLNVWGRNGLVVNLSYLSEAAIDAQLEEGPMVLAM